MKNKYKTFSLFALATALLLTGCQSQNNSSVSEAEISSVTESSVSETETSSVTESSDSSSDNDYKNDKYYDNDKSFYEFASRTFLYNITSDNVNVEISYYAEKCIISEDYIHGLLFLAADENFCRLSNPLIDNVGIKVSVDPQQSFDIHSVEINDKNYKILVFKSVVITENISNYHIGEYFATFYIIDDGKISLLGNGKVYPYVIDYTINNDIITISDTESYRIDPETNDLVKL